MQEYEKADILCGSIAGVSCRAWQYETAEKRGHWASGSGCVGPSGLAERGSQDAWTAGSGRSDAIISLSNRNKSPIGQLGTVNPHRHDLLSGGPRCASDAFFSAFLSSQFSRLPH